MAQDVTETLEQAAKRIAAHLAKADKADEQATNHRLAAAQVMKGVRPQFETELEWRGWCKERMPDKSKTEQNRLLSWAQTDDPAAAREEENASKRAVSQATSEPPGVDKEPTQRSSLAALTAEADEEYASVEDRDNDPKLHANGFFLRAQEAKDNANQAEYPLDKLDVTVEMIDAAEAVVLAWEKVITTLKGKIK
jgi:hypothetical protein